MNDIVQVKAAVAEFRPNEEDVRKDQVRLSMQTADGITVEFDLDLVSVAILALTLQPALREAKTRVDSRGL